MSGWNLYIYVILYELLIKRITLTRIFHTEYGEIIPIGNFQMEWFLAFFL